MTVVSMVEIPCPSCCRPYKIGAALSGDRVSAHPGRAAPQPLHIPAAVWASYLEGLLDIDDLESFAERITP